MATRTSKVAIAGLAALTLALGSVSSANAAWRGHWGGGHWGGGWHGGGWHRGGWGWGAAGLAVGTGLAIAATAPYRYGYPYYGYGYPSYAYDDYSYAPAYPYAVAYPYRRAYYGVGYYRPRYYGYRGYRWASHYARWH